MYKILSKLTLSASLIVMSAIATESIKDDFTKHINEVKKNNQTIAWMQDDGTLRDNVSKTSDSIESDNIHYI